MLAPQFRIVAQLQIVALLQIVGQRLALPRRRASDAALESAQAAASHHLKEQMLLQVPL